MLIFVSDSCTDSEELAARADNVLSYIGKNRIGKISKTDKGAPICKNWFMSLAHTDGKILLVLSEKPVGIDIERTDRKAPESFGDIRNWTAYEAICKMKGEGIKLSEVRKGGNYAEKVSFHNFLSGYVIAVACVDNDVFTVWI